MSSQGNWRANPSSALYLPIGDLLELLEKEGLLNTSLRERIMELAEIWPSQLQEEVRDLYKSQYEEDFKQLKVLAINSVECLICDRRGAFLDLFLRAFADYRAVHPEFVLDSRVSSVVMLPSQLQRTLRQALRRFLVDVGEVFEPDHI